jgi:hypothetical protein
VLLLQIVNSKKKEAIGKKSKNYYAKKEKFRNSNKMKRKSKNFFFRMKNRNQQSTIAPIAIT